MQKVLSQKGLWAFLGILLIFLIYSVIYIALDQLPEHIDQAVYLDHGAQVYQTIVKGHWGEAWSQLFHISPKKPFLIEFWISLSFLIFGPSLASPKWLNLVAYVGLAIYLYRLIKHYFAFSASAIFLIFSAFFFTPYINGMIFNVLPEYPMAICLTVSYFLFFELCFLKKYSDFSRITLISYCITLGLFCGLTFMAKQTALGFYIPMFVYGIYFLIKNKPYHVYFLIVLIVMALVIGPYYLTFYHSMLKYARIASQMEGCHYPFIKNLVHYCFYFFTPIAVAFFMGALILGFKKRQTLSPIFQKMCLLVLSTFSLIFSVVNLSANNSVRFLFPILPLFTFILAMLFSLCLVSNKHFVKVSIFVSCLFVINVFYIGFGGDQLIKQQPLFLLKNTVFYLEGFNGGFLRAPVKEPFIQKQFFLNLVRTHSHGKLLKIELLTPAHYNLAYYYQAWIRVNGYNDLIYAFYEPEKGPPDYRVGWVVPGNQSSVGNPEPKSREQILKEGLADGYHLVQTLPDGPNLENVYIFSKI